MFMNFYCCEIKFWVCARKFATTENRIHHKLTLIKDLIHCSTKEWELNWASGYPTRLSIYSFIYLLCAIITKQIWHKYFLLANQITKKPVNRIAKD